MALLEDLVCTECGKSFKGVFTQNYGAMCEECIEARDNAEKQAWLERRRKDKTPEERIAWIEEYIYDVQREGSKFDPLEIMDKATSEET